LVFATLVIAKTLISCCLQVHKIKSQFSKVNFQNLTFITQMMSYFLKTCH